MLDAARSNEIGDDFIVIGTIDVRFPSCHRSERSGSSTGCGRRSLPKGRFESGHPVDGCGIHPFGGRCVDKPVPAVTRETPADRHDTFIRPHKDTIVGTRQIVAVA
jgi:hypothetical protein